MSFTPSVLGRANIGSTLNLRKTIATNQGQWDPPHEFVVQLFTFEGIVLVDSEERRLTVSGSDLNAHFEIKEQT